MDDLIDGLLIPAAFFGDDLVYVHQGRTGDRYRCAGENCSVPVIWKESYDREDGVLVRAHFSHISGGAGSCVESARHKIAKLTVVKQINRWRDGSGPVPVLSGKCKACGMVNVHQLWWLSPSETARNEYRLPSGRVADVWAGFAVEVHETHEVDTDKAHDLSTDNIQWIEIEAGSVLDSLHVPSWTSTKPGPPSQCVRCLMVDRERARIEAATEKEAANEYARKVRGEADAYAAQVRAQAVRCDVHEAHASRVLRGEILSKDDAWRVMPGITWATCECDVGDRDCLDSVVFDGN